MNWSDLLKAGEFPSSHHREEGWRSDRWDKEHHPGCVDKDASRHFLEDAATPPRGDARRGIALFQNATSTLNRAVSASKEGKTQRLL